MSGPEDLLKVVHTEPERLEVLKAWRTKARAHEKPGRALTDTHLAQVARLYGQSPALIRRALPSSVADPVLAMLLAALDGVCQVSAAQSPVLAGSSDAAAPISPTSPTAATASPSSAPPPSSPSIPAPGPGPDLVDGVGSIDPELAMGWASYVGMPPPAELGVISTRPAQGQTQLIWLPAPDSAEVTVYRVVAGDDHQPFAPESARLVAATRQCHAVDSAAPSGPVRYIQVWVNQGATLEEAKRSQPRPHARRTVVTPLSGLTLREKEGRIVGRWSVDPTVRVSIFRIPAEAAHAHTVQQEQYRLCAGKANRTGFVDDTAPRGRSFVYRLVVEAHTPDGLVQLSAPTDYPVDVTGILAAVDDLAVRSADPRPGCVLELAWSTAPGGVVQIHSTSAEPPAGIDHEVHWLEQLQQMGLTDQSELLDPTDELSVHGQTVMSGVPWPVDWDRIYLTPVTVLQGRAIVGTTISAVGARPVLEPRLVERVDEQVLTFGWPDGAASVSLYVTRPDTDPLEACAGLPQSTITQQEYRRFGGARLKLPTTGCRVVLTSTAYEGGRQFNGAPVPVDYLGLLRIRYSVHPVRKLFARKSAAARIKVWADLSAPGAKTMELKGSPAFVVVHNPQRLPLHHQDGSRLPVGLFEDGAPPAQLVFTPSTLLDGTSGAGWRVELNGVRGGFIRLFAEVAPQQRSHIAVLDPAVTSLRIP